MAIRTPEGGRPQLSQERETLLQTIAEHTGRLVAYYDFATQLLRICRPGKRISGWLACGDVPAMRALSEKSQRRVEQLLEEVRGSAADGEAKLRLVEEERERWIAVSYSSLRDGVGAPVGAIISCQDISEHHRNELAYLRQKQLAEQGDTHIGQLEVDLVENLIEVQGGRLQSLRVEGHCYTDFAEKIVELRSMEEDKAEAGEFFSARHLLEQYNQGRCKLERTWKMWFHDGSSGWVRVEVDLVPEPYTGHIKAFIRLTDITLERETQLLIEQRAERDGLTGLLNRVTLENRVREGMKHDAAPGILCLIDMDNLKTINDVYGHGAGDRAIQSIAQALKAHFRQTDVIGRLGGDEFLVYLRGAAENAQAITASLESFLQRLSSTPVEGMEERSIQCSIGCAIQGPEANEFEELYRRADVALYHVKRGTKNGIAFYEAQLEKQNDDFRMESVAREMQRKEPQLPEGQRMLDIVLGYYDMVLAVNLTANRYHLVAEAEGGVFNSLPAFGSYDDFFALALKGVHPEDAPFCQAGLSRDGIIQGYRDGRRGIQAHFRFLDKGEFRWVEVTTILYVNEVGDICDFALLRWNA